MGFYIVSGLEGITGIYSNGRKLSKNDSIHVLKNAKLEAYESLKILNVQTFFPENISLENAIINLCAMVKKEIPKKGKVLDVGHGLNTKVMSHFKNEWYEVSGIDVIMLPDKNEQAHYENPYSKKGIKHLMKTTEDIEELGIVDGVKRYWGDFIYWNALDKQDLIYFWGSWSSRSQNLTVGNLSKNHFYKDEVIINTDNVEEKLAILEYEIKKWTIKKARESLNPNGSLMIVNPLFTKLGAAHLSSDDEIIDYLEILTLLKDTGYKEAKVYGATEAEDSELSKVFKDKEVKKPLVILAK